jgi:hypothetical protein
MKDSHGRYWCLPCGEADQRRQAMASPTANCAGCHKPFPKGKLDKHGEHWFCKACWKKRTKTQGSRVSPAATADSRVAASGSGAAVAISGGNPGDRRRVMMLAALLVAPVLISLLFNYVWAG